MSAVTTADPESESEWWHNVMTRPWPFTVFFESTGGPIEVGQGAEFKNGQIVVLINGRMEIYPNKADLLQIYTEEKAYKIEWHEE